MRSEQLMKIVRRTMTDEMFLDSLLASPRKALAEYELSDEEFEVILIGDETRLNAMLGQSGRIAHNNANQYHHSQHQGNIGQEPDLLPRTVLE